MIGWETDAKFQAMTFWNHDILPSQDDAYVRSFHWLAVSRAVSFCVIPLHYSFLLPIKKEYLFIIQLGKTSWLFLSLVSLI